MKWLMAGLLLMLTGTAKAAPYLYYPLTPGYSYSVSNGALFDSHFNLVMDFTNYALVYHPLSSGSIIPVELQKWVPPESWSIDLGGGWSGGVALGGVGFGLNLLDSVRGWASNLLALSSNASLNAAGKQIAPGNGPLNLHVTWEPTAEVFVNGQFAKNPMKLTNHWFLGPSYSF